MKELTKRQREVLDFIKLSKNSSGRPPTLREICIAFGMSSTNAAYDHLVALERKGYITRDSMVSRGIRLLIGPPKNSALIDETVEKIRYARRTHLKVGTRQVLKNEPLFIAEVRKILEDVL